MRKILVGILARHYKSLEVYDERNDFKNELSSKLKSKKTRNTKKAQTAEIGLEMAK